jgi:hypothetical protein
MTVPYWPGAVLSAAMPSAASADAVRRSAEASTITWPTSPVPGVARSITSPGRSG